MQTREFQFRCAIRRRCCRIASPDSISGPRRFTGAKYRKSQPFIAYLTSNRQRCLWAAKPALGDGPHHRHRLELRLKGPGSTWRGKGSGSIFPHSSAKAGPLADIRSVSRPNECLKDQRMFTRCPQLRCRAERALGRAQNEAGPTARLRFAKKHRALSAATLGERASWSAAPRCAPCQDARSRLRRAP